MKKTYKQKIKPLILLIFLFAFYSNICIAAYHETNTSTSEISTSTIEQIELTFPERIANDNLKNELNSENTSINIINYKKPYFWLLIFSLVLIILILMRLFKKLSHMDREFKNYESKLKKIEPTKEISEKDEIIYSINDTNTLNPESPDEGVVKKIEVNTESHNEDDEEIIETKKINIKSNNSKEEIVKIKSDKNEDDDYIFEE